RGVRPGKSPGRSLHKPLEIVDERELDQLRGESGAVRVDELALELLAEQEGPEFLAHLFEEFGADPWALAADDLDALDVDAVLPVLVEMPALTIGRGHLNQPPLGDREHRIERRLHRVA